MPKRKHPRRSIGRKCPKGGYPVPDGGYAIPARSRHDSVYVTSVINESPDLHRLARVLVDWAKQELKEQADVQHDEHEPTSSDQHPSPQRSQ